MSHNTPVPPPPVRPLPLSPMTPLLEPQPTAISEPSRAHLHAGFLSPHQSLSVTDKTPLLLLSPPPPAAPHSSHRSATSPLPPYFFSFSFCAVQQQVAHLFFPGLASSPPSMAVQPSRLALWQQLSCSSVCRGADATTSALYFFVKMSSCLVVKMSSYFLE
jgi:hypothetical protein